MRFSLFAFFVLTPIAFGQIRINCGGAAYTDTAGNSWLADSSFSGGGGAIVTTSTIANTTDQPIYQSRHWGPMAPNPPLTYTFTGLTPGSSQNVTLKFAEVTATSAGQRVFNVTANGTVMLSNLDIFAAAGGALKALDKSFTATASSSGQLQIAFVGVLANPIVSGIAVVPASSTPGGITVTVLPSSITLNSGQTAQFAASVGGTSNTAVAWSLSPSMGSVSQTGLYTAPSTVTTAQAVSVTATSMADSTKSSSGTAMLAASQTTPVAWTCSPPLVCDQTTGVISCPSCVVVDAQGNATILGILKALSIQTTGSATGSATFSGQPDGYVCFVSGALISKSVPCI